MASRKQTKKKTEVVETEKTTPPNKKTIEDIAEIVTTGKVDKESVHKELTEEQVQSIIQDVSNEIIENEQINTDLFDILSSVEFYSELLISGILNSSGTLYNESKYMTSFKRQMSSILGKDTSMKITEYLTDTADNYYNLSTILPDAIEKSRVTKGSYYSLIVPVDKLSDTKPVKNKGEKIDRQDEKIASEGTIDISIPYVSDSNTDNQNELTQFEFSLNYSDNVSKIANIDEPEVEIDFQSEDEEDKSLASDLVDNFTKALNKTKATKVNKFIDLSLINQKKPVDYMRRPFNVEVPSSAVVPVLTKGTSIVVGYYIIIDPETGTPINPEIDKIDSSYKSKDGSEYQGVMSAHETLGDTNKFVEDTQRTMKQIKKNLGNKTQRTRGLPDVVSSTNTKKIIAQKLNESLVSLSETQSFKDLSVTLGKDVYDSLLYNILRKQKTELIFVPKENMIDLTFKRNINGTGKPIIEKVRSQIIMLIKIKLASFMKNIEDNLTMTTINLELPDDVDDVTNALVLKQEIEKAWQQKTSNLFSLQDTGNVETDFLSARINNSVSVKISATAFPTVSVEKQSLSEKNNGSSERTVNDPMMEELKNEIIQAFSLTDSIVNDSKDANLVIKVIQSNDLVKERMNKLQFTVNSFLTNFMEKIMLNDLIVKEDIINMLKESKELKKTLKIKDIKNVVVEDFVYNNVYNDISRLVVATLPAYVKSGSDETINGLKDILESATEILESIIPENMEIPKSITKLGIEDIESLRAILKTAVYKDLADDVPWLNKIFRNINPGNIEATVKDVLTSTTSTDGKLNHENTGLDSIDNPQLPPESEETDDSVDDEETTDDAEIKDEKVDEETNEKT